MTSSKTKIGITLRIVNAENYSEKRDALSHDWPEFFEKMDFYPIYIPNTLSNLEKFLDEMQVDGLVISGGDNIGDDPARDKTEKIVIEFALKNEIPILGICRGMQVLNNYFGGKITKNKDTSHRGNPHNVEITNKKFSSLLEIDSLNVNSFHNNIIEESNLGADLDSFAISHNDNTIEGFFHKQFPILGVMWHPERKQSKYDAIILKNLFESQNFWED